MLAPSRDLTFGSYLTPNASEGPRLLHEAAVAEELGYDLIGVPDHPDYGHQVDQLALMSAIIGHTKRIELFGAISALALRPPFMLARAAASLDCLAPGRFHLGLGSGVMPGITTIGGSLWSPGESIARMREAIELTRLVWAGESPASYSGEFYRIDEASVPSPPSRNLDIWIGATKPRMRRLIAQAADGWIPSGAWITPEEIGPQVEHLNAELETAGRPLGDVRRVYVTVAKKLQPASEGFLMGPAEQWVDQLTQITLDFGFDTFLFGDREGDRIEHLRVIADRVIPHVRANVAAELVR